MGLSDLPLPPNIPRPEMWTPESIVQAVKDGFTFLIPFHLENFETPNGYYIHAQQYFCTGVTVGPDHTPDIEVTPEGWLAMTLYFPRGMVPDAAFRKPIDKRGVGPVWASIDPVDIDWDSLNRGHQIRISGGLRRNPDEEIRNLRNAWLINSDLESYQNYALAAKRLGLVPDCFFCQKETVEGDCDDCGITVCYQCIVPCDDADCQVYQCPNCADLCDQCQKPLCREHHDVCTRCDKNLCQKGQHAGQCDWCNNFYCFSHMVEGALAGLPGYDYICSHCESIARDNQTDWISE